MPIIFAQEILKIDSLGCPAGQQMSVVSSPELCGCNHCECSICAYCGDGIVLNHEECDDGNDILDDGCRKDCKLPYCGDGIWNPLIEISLGQTCDFNDPMTGIDCRDNCTKCGDNKINHPDEECDGSDTPKDSICRPNCKLALCGDGIIDLVANETCDFGITPESAEYIPECRKDSFKCTYCGDWIIEPALEECDSSNLGELKHPNASCSDTCTVNPYCGDKIIQNQEQCDDGNTVNNDNCSNTCGLPFCGDRIVQSGEQCDDGNTVNNDNCSNTCGLPFCGDRIVQSGEQCDDGNTINNDGCTSSCHHVNPCDGVVSYKQCSCSGGIVNGYYNWSGRINLFIRGTDNSTICFSESCLRCNESFDPFTKITLANGELKIAKDLTVDDQLMTPIGEPVGIKQIVQSGEKTPLYELKAGANILKITQDHVVWTESGYKTAKELKSGDRVKLESGKVVSLEAVTELPVKINQRVIGIELDVKGETSDDYLMIGGGFVIGDYSLEKQFKAQNK